MHGRDAKSKMLVEFAFRIERAEYRSDIYIAVRQNQTRWEQDESIRASFFRSNLSPSSATSTTRLAIIPLPIWITDHNGFPLLSCFERSWILPTTRNGSRWCSRPTAAPLLLLQQRRVNRITFTTLRATSIIITTTSLLPALWRAHHQLSQLQRPWR